MSKKRKAKKLLKRRPKSWLGVVCLLFSLGAVAFNTYDFDTEGKVTDRTKIFEAFADLDTDVDTVIRMRNSPLPPRNKPGQAKWRTIVEVMDGDTIRLDGGDTVRLIGVDAPESSINRTWVFT